MDQKELDKILDLHEKWVKGQEGGRTAILKDEDLTFLDFSERNLEGIILSECKASGAFFDHSNLRRAMMCNSRMDGATFCCADLERANLCNSRFAGAEFEGAILRNAHIEGANITDSGLTGATLDGVYFDENTCGFLPVCPEEGGFYGWKKVVKMDECDNAIAKLWVGPDAKRSSGTTRKCRADKALVIGFYDVKSGGKINIQKAHSSYDKNFVYKIGDVVLPDSFDENRWAECSNGIHFFMTRKEAENYYL